MKISTPFTPEVIQSLKGGDVIQLTGEIYTARDAAHALMVEAIQKGEAPPFPYQGQAVFYAGPCPAPKGKPIGSVGPTTSGRMDPFAPTLIAEGLKVMIGKGSRSQAVLDAIVAHQGLYLIAIGGVAALLAQCVTHAEVVAYDHLGTEAVRRLTVKDMPLVVAVDSQGRTC